MEIGAGTESFLSSGQDGNVQRVVLFECFKSLRERQRTCGIHRVTRVRAVDGDDHHFAVAFHNHRLGICHVFLQASSHHSAISTQSCMLTTDNTDNTEKAVCGSICGRVIQTSESVSSVALNG